MGLFLPRQTVVSPVGLVTQPNQYGQYPSGSQRIARNVTLRNPGELVQAPDVQGVLPIGSANQVVHKLMPLNNGHVYALCVSGSTWQVTEQDGTTLFGPSFIGSATDAFSATGRISWARVAERLMVNGNFGFLVGDYMAPSSAGERALRAAGLPQPTIRVSTITDSAIGFLGEGQMVGYTACFAREFADGYQIVSAPAPAVKFLKNPADVTATAPFNVVLQVYWRGASLIAGDRIDIYRTDTVNTTAPTVDPGVTFKLVRSYTVTSTDVTNESATITDKAPTLPGTLECPGEELYTNPGQETETYSNRRPPIAKCMASFKGFAFYGNTTERAQFKFSVPGGLGGEYELVTSGLGIEVGTFKASGIGVRVGPGTITIGSPTITGVAAADLVGIVVGQRYDSNDFPANTTVTAVGATTITMSQNAVLNNTGFYIADVLELNGTTFVMDSLDRFLFDLDGRYEITSSLSISGTSPRLMVGFELTLETNTHPLNANITVRGTNGQNYSPPIPGISQTVKTITPLTRKNRVQWSKEQQPEHAPSVSEGFVGFAELYAMNESRDALWIACSDGLFRLSGDGGAGGLGNWQVDYANSTLLLAGPQASAVMNEFWYGYTNIGFVEVDSAGNLVNLSDKILGDLLPGQKYTESRSIVVVCNEKDGEVLLILGETAGKSSTVYVFNTKMRGWTTLGGNGANLSNITALAMQRSPISGEPRPLFGVSAEGGAAPSFSGWNNASSFLAHEVRYQPFYGDDPLEVKRWLWADYLFDTGSNGDLITPQWNGTTFGGQVAIEAFDQGGYARAGCPREVARSHSISPGFLGAAGASQARFQGISLALKQSTNQSKKR